MAPEVEGSSPFTHPIFRIGNYAPVAQLDRVADFESVGRRFESYRARQKKRVNVFRPNFIEIFSIGFNKGP